MRSTLLSGLALVSSTWAVPAELKGRQVPTKTCSHITGGVHVIASGGDGIQNTGMYGLLGSLATSILNAIPGSTNVTLPYNKDQSQYGPGRLSDGATTLHNYIAEYHQYCPNTKIVLIGYSSGAVIQMNTLCGAQAPFTKPPGPIGSGGNPDLVTKIIASVVYGDLTRTPGVYYDYGTGGQQCDGRSVRSNANQCVSSFAYQSFCDLGDPQCCPNAGAQDPNIHFEYPQKYDQRATQFVVQQFNAKGGA